MRNPLLIRAIGLPALLFIGIVALAIARTGMRSAPRGFLIQLWGGTLLLLSDAAAVAALLWADETPGEIVRNAEFNTILFGLAMTCLGLGLALGWKARVEGERFLVAIVHPPPTVNTRSLRSWAIVPLGLLWLALTSGAFAVTYGILSHFTPTGR